MSLIEKLFSAIQYLLPHHLLSSLVHAFMRIRLAPVKNAQISLIGSMVGVNWSEAKSSELSDFDTFNDFFTRELADGARPIDPDPLAFVCPSDGKISHCGRITNDRLVQAKGRHYSIRSLLANDPASPEFLNGFFHTIYLSPRDYHRVHMPFGGTLQRMVHVPGRLFSVAPYTVRQVPGLFARNERVISLFETTHGPMAPGACRRDAGFQHGDRLVRSGNAAARQKNRQRRLVAPRYRAGKRRRKWAGLTWDRP